MFFFAIYIIQLKTVTLDGKGLMHEILPKLTPVVPGISVTILHTAQTILRQEN
jgi:hypothetical protein